MATKKVTRGKRKLTGEEKKRLRELRGQIELERDDIVRQGREAFAAHEQALAETIQKLKSTREQLGLTLQEVADRMGANRANVHRLENSFSNPTFATLNRYAEALGKRIVIALEDDHAA